MPNDNVTQYATLFDAFGCELRYNSSDATISIVEVPSGSKTLIDGVLNEIKYFDNTKNYHDGMAALCIAKYIDDEKNPIAPEARNNILNALGFMKDDKYIRQVLMLQKNNRSWHFSAEANTCSYFGEECTHRGINPNPEHKGKRSNRKPEEYHDKMANGQIKREQLVTANLEQMSKTIPEDKLISTTRNAVSIDAFDLRAFKKLEVTEQVEFISKLQEAIAS